MKVRSNRVVNPETRGYALALIWVLFAMALCVTPLADFLTVRAAGPDGTGGRYSLIIRSFVVVALLYATFIGGNAKRTSCINALLAIFPVAVAAVAVLKGDMSATEFAAQGIFVSKIFSFFVYAAALSSLSERQRVQLEPFVLYALLIYALAIIMGATFSIDMFRSYQADTQVRSGYKGIVFAQNEASALMITGLGYAYLQVLRFGWRKRLTLVIVMLTAASMLIGTKAAAVGAFAVTCVYLFARHSAVGAAFKALVAVAGLFTIAIAAYTMSPAVHDAVSLTFDYFTYHYEHARGNAVLTILLSGRDVKFSQVWADLTAIDYLPILTGGYPVTRYLIEIDLPDLILCMGLPVFCCYLTAFRGQFMSTHPGPVARYGQYFFILILAVASTAGHTLNSAVTSPYLALTAVMIRRSK